MSQLSPESPKKGASRKRSPMRAYLGLLISLACLWWVLSSIELEELFARIRSVDPLWLLLAAVTTLSSYVVRSFRWQFFFGERPPSLYDSYRCLIVGFFMNNVLPARIGEFIRAHLGGRATGQSRSVVLATIAGERLADGLMISVLFAVLFTLGATQDELHRTREIFYVAYLFLFATIGTGVVLLLRERIFNLLERLDRRMPGHLSTYTLVRIRRFIVGLEPLLKPSRLSILSVLSLIVWLIELLVYYQVSRAFDVPMSLAGLSLFLAAVNFSSLIPAAPGGIGVIEAFATMALVRIGLDKETALAMVASQHLIQYVMVGIPGAWFFFLTLGGRLPDEDQDDEEESVAQEESAEDDEEPTKPIEAIHSIPKEFSAADDSSVLDISIVIPAFNEEDRISNTVFAILKYLEGRSSSFEILVVDDGSTDATATVVRELAEKIPELKLLVYPENRGKGYAVRFGVANARGALVLYTDADGAAPIEELDRLKSALEQGADVAIGSRAMSSRETKIKTVLHRKLIGRVFNGIVNVLLLPGIADTQCGFKLFTRKAAKDLFSRQQADRFSFDVEVLFLARKSGYQIVEVPINWTNIPGSKVNLLCDSARMFFDVLRFRMRAFSGAYDVAAEENSLGV